MLCVCITYVTNCVKQDLTNTSEKNTKHGCVIWKMSKYLNIPFQCPNVFNTTSGNNNGTTPSFKCCSSVLIPEGAIVQKVPH